MPIKSHALTFFIIGFGLTLSTVAAEKIDLSKHNMHYLAPYLQRSSAPRFSALSQSLVHKTQVFTQSTSASKARPMIALKPVQVHQDFNGTSHYRLNQTYKGYPVWGAQAIIHIPKVRPSSSTTTTLSGSIYQNLQHDLGTKAPFTDAQAKKALQYIKSNPSQNFSNAKTKTIVYVDHNNKAHWAYLFSFSINSPPKRPNIIMDAQTFHVLERWNNLHALKAPRVYARAEGYGGNGNTGKYTYGVLLPTLKVTRDPTTETCYLENDAVRVENAQQSNSVYQFSCKDNPKQLYNDGYDEVNGAYSPSNDAFFAGTAVQQLYKAWYGTDALKNSDGAPMQIEVRVHFGNHYENAYWDEINNYVVFGDGDTTFYPLTSLGVVAHEISHGFTQGNSGLIYLGQSGALNEAFSDMAAKAAEFFIYGQNNWVIGKTIAKKDTLRYMYDPTKDGLSIGNAKDYDKLLNAIKAVFDNPDDRNSYIVHTASGVFNKAFYLLGTAQGWNTHKAFNVMVKANQDYWQPAATFETAVCGVIHATEDYAKQDPSYDVVTVKNVFAQVGVGTDQCTGSETQQKASS